MVAAAWDDTCGGGGRSSYTLGGSYLPVNRLVDSLVVE